MNPFQQTLDNMWYDYLQLTPDAAPIHQLFAAINNGEVINDHIALRTFNTPNLGIDQLAKPFVDKGYTACGEYEFVEKKLFARHYEHSDERLPKVFISELLVDELSPEAQVIINELVQDLPQEQLNKPDFCYSGRPWSLTIAQYQTLEKESEYASWVAAHGFRPNHFTVSLNHLTPTRSLEWVNEMLQQNGYVLNDNGGLIKGSPEVLLEQSSTVAKSIPVQFIDGEMEIPGCYYEFARRYPLLDGKLYQGFVAASADKIFESTNAK